MRLTWVQPEDLIGHELRQAREEGKQVDAIEARWHAAGGHDAPPRAGASSAAARPELRALAERLLDEVAELASPLAEDEPERYPFAGQSPAPSVSPAELARRVDGAWLGRVVGCVLGKPVEKLPREGIRELLESAGRWPLDGWFSAEGVAREVLERWPWNRRSAATSLRETIAGIPEDDDLNFMLVALDVLERHGPSFSTDDVASAWLDSLPAGRVFTAERVAYRNLLCGLVAPATATYRNPFREWIGARLRVELHGLTRPGDPAGAAAAAARDARLSHTANGVYAATFMAAACAAAAAGALPADAVAAGLGAVPPRSRLGRALRDAQGLAASARSWEGIVDELDRRARRAALGARRQQHRARGRCALPLRLRLRRRDLRRRVGRARHRHERRRGRHDRGCRRGRRGHRRALERAPGRSPLDLAAGLRRRHPARARRADARAGWGVTDGARDPWAPRPIDLPRTVPLAADADLSILDGGKILAAPDDPDDWPAWRAALTRWRDEAHARVAYDDRAYDDPAFAWTRSCFSVALIWLWDEQLYDWQRDVFTPDAFLAAAERDFGGFDGVVLWHAYPVIGLDDRNQFDWYRDAPGLPELVAALQARGVRVFVDYNPWDSGTRREAVADGEAVAEIVRTLGADGVFLDTMKHALPGLREAIDEARPGVAFEGESTLPLERIVDHHLSWAQWFADSPTPGVLRARWFERRHMLHQTRRWNRDHSDELRSAWLNGAGMLVWESVFGSWVGWNARDRSLLRAMVAVQRRYAGLLSEGAFTPLAARSADGPWPSIVGSRFAADGVALWALVNRTPIDVHGVELELGDVPVGSRVFDLVAGVELEPGRIRLGLPRRGIGALLALAPELADEAFERFLEERRRPAHSSATRPSPTVPHAGCRRPRPLPRRSRPGCSRSIRAR